MNFSLSSLKNKVSALSLGKDENYLQSIVEDISLQMPTYHSGILVAYSTNYVASTALQKDIKFSWYRSGFKREELELIDDSSNRPWYIPSADDIGFKMCVQCEDVFEKGFNRYRESTVIRPDPLLCSSIEAAVENTFYETNDVSISFGNVIKSAQEITAESFDARLRYSALSSSSRACYFGCDSPSKFRVEITEAGVMLCPAMMSEDGTSPTPTTYNTSGLLIKASSGIKVTCQYPVCCVISIPLAEEDRSSWDSSSALPSASTKKSKLLPWLWLGLDGSPLQVGVNKVLSSLPHGVQNNLLISIACGDRTQRDSIALVSRALCACSSGSGSGSQGTELEEQHRRRRAMLPWNRQIPLLFSSVAGTGTISPPPVETTTESADTTASAFTTEVSAAVSPPPGAAADVAASLAGYDSSQLLGRIKTLEGENAQLRKARHQLALQQVGSDSRTNKAGVETNSSNSSSGEGSSLTGRRSDGSDGGDSGAAVLSLRKELQTLIGENETLVAALSDAKKEHDKASLALRHAIEELSYEANAKDQSLEVLRQQLGAAQTDLEAIKQQSNFEKLVSQQKFKALQDQLGHDTGDREMLTKELNQKDLELQSLTEEIKCVLRDCNVLKQELREEQNKAYHQQEEREQLDSLLAAALEDKSTLQIQYDSASQELAAFRSECEELKRINSELSVAQTAHVAEIESLRVEKEHLLNRNALHGQALVSAEQSAALLAEEKTKSEKLAVELGQYRRKHEALSKELKRVLKDIKEQDSQKSSQKDSQRELEASLLLKTQECAELEIQLASALTALSDAQPTDRIPKSPAGAGAVTGAGTILSSSRPTPASGVIGSGSGGNGESNSITAVANTGTDVGAGVSSGVSVLLDAGRRRSAFGGMFGSGVEAENSSSSSSSSLPSSSNDVTGDYSSTFSSSTHSISNSMSLFLPPTPAPPPLKTTSTLLNPHSAAPLKPVTPTKMTTSLGIVANGMLRSTSNTVRNILMMSAAGNANNRMPPRPSATTSSSSTININFSRDGMNGSSTSYSTTAIDEDTNSNHSEDADNNNRNSLDEKLTSYYHTTESTDTSEGIPETAIGVVNSIASSNSTT